MTTRGPERDPELPHRRHDQYRVDDRRRQSYHSSDDGPPPARGGASRESRGHDPWGDRRSDRGHYQNPTRINQHVNKQGGTNQSVGERSAHPDIASGAAGGKENVPFARAKIVYDGAAHDSSAIDNDGDVSMAGSGGPPHPLQRSKSVSVPTGEDPFPGTHEIAISLHY